MLFVRLLLCCLSFVGVLFWSAVSVLDILPNFIFAVRRNSSAYLAGKSASHFRLMLIFSFEGDCPSHDPGTRSDAAYYIF